MSSRRMLAISWVMPPLVFPRSLQISRTLRALAERGWETTVITVPLSVEPHAAQDAELARFYSGSYDLQYVEPREEVVASPWWLRQLREYTETKNLLAENWIRRASGALGKRIRAERPEVFVSFAQPWLNHLVGLNVKRKHPRLPWVAHFSDPWVDSAYFSPSDQEERELAVRQERSIMETADAIIFTTQETADLVMAKYPAAWSSRVHVVGHGFDSDLLGLLQPRQKSNCFTIAHTGNLYDKREPLALLRALSVLRTEVADSTKFQVHFVGHATQAMREMIAVLELDDVVTLSPNIPFLESLAIAAAADLLLVIDAPAEHSVFLPSKVVDYLSLHRPILALTPLHGASARVLGGLGFPLVDPLDETGILSKLREALKRWEDGLEATEIPSSDALGRFDIRQAAAEFETAVIAAIDSGRQVNG